MTLKLICCSHSPLINMITPPGGVQDSVRDVFGELYADMREFDPELIVIFSPDHYSGFFYDVMPPFCVGAAAESINDFDCGPGPLAVPEELALHLVNSLRAADLDVAISYRMSVDHGVALPLNLITGGLDRYPVIPIFVNCISTPAPSCRRVRQLGHAVGEWAANQERRVLLIGSGGLSHDPQFPQIETASENAREFLITRTTPDQETRIKREQRALEISERFAKGEGPNRPLNEHWDREFLDLLTAQNLTAVDGFSDEWITAQGGGGGHEIRSWIAAFAALAAAGEYRARVNYYRPIPEWLVGMGIMQAANA